MSLRPNFAAGVGRAVARKQLNPQAIEPSDDLYVPVGIEEIPREGAAPKVRRGPAAPKASAGASDFVSVKDSARHTLEGLKNFEWASLFGTLSNYAAFPAVALLALTAYTAQSRNDLGGGQGAAILAGWALGALTLGLLLIALIFVFLGAWAFHIGRNELGILQRREVEKSEKALWRGIYALIPGAGVALVLASQEGYGDYRQAGVPFATALALAVGLVSGAIAARYFAIFFTNYLRNLAPKAGKRGRRRLRLLTVLGAAFPFAVVLAGTPLLAIDYDYLCYFNNGACPPDEGWLIIAPTFGPPSHVTPHLSAYLPVSAVYGSVVVAALLLVSRFFALLALRSFRKQIREAEIFLRDLVRKNAPEAAPPG